MHDVRSQSVCDHKKELKRLVQEGPVTEIVKAEQALSLLDVTGAVADQINENKYGEVISTIQNLGNRGRIGDIL